MTTAAPTRKLSRKPTPLEPDVVKPEQLSPLDIGLGETPFHHPAPPQIQPVDKPLTKSYEDTLAFEELPVTIFANPVGGDQAPLYLEAWVNGKGIEQWMPQFGGWVEVKHIPVGEEVTIKRKYLGNLLRSKTLLIATPEDKADGSIPRNLINRRTVNSQAITIVRDDHPLGREWAKRMQAASV